MPRRIPWLSSNNSNTKAGPSVAVAKPIPATPIGPPAAKRQRTQPTDAPDDDPLANIEYMRSSDDDWIMVEDEFLSTAQLYTRSVHRQEYQRLQLEAASKNAGKISSIQRPVTGKAVLSKADVQKRTLSRSALGGSSEEEEEVEEEKGGVGSKTGRGKSDLMMLMRAETGSQASLSMLMPQKKVATRAAAGYTNSQVSSHRRSLASICNQQNAEPAALANSSGIAAVRKHVYAAPASATSTDNDDDDDDDDDLDAPAVSHGRHSRNPCRQPTSALALASPKVALSLDSDDDLDAPVMRHRRRFVASPRRPASMPLPASAKPPAVRGRGPERSAEAAARPPPPKPPLLLDSDEDVSSLMPKQLPGPRFKGRSMAARERATKGAG